jgi:hypothetical protein
MLTKEMRKEAAKVTATRAVSMEFPELRIVRREAVLPHEKVDTARQIRLIDRLSRDGVLKNPPIVARLGSTRRHLLLDGANRVSALYYLNAPHLLVQVEEYDDPNLVLSHWNHVVRDLEAKTLVDMIQNIHGVYTLESQNREDPMEDDRMHLCTVVLGEQRVFHVFGGRDVFDRIHFLRKITELYYHGEARIDRVNHEELDVIRKHHSNFGALICYRDFTKDEVREAAEHGCRLPSGLTRFLLPRRVLGFNFSVEILRSNLSLEEKQHRLEEAIQKKVNEKLIRYYGEPTFVFDD